MSAPGVCDLDPLLTGVLPGRCSAPGGPAGPQGCGGAEEFLRSPEEPGLWQGYQRQQGGPEELWWRPRSAQTAEEDHRQRSQGAGHWYVSVSFFCCCLPVFMTI